MHECECAWGRACVRVNVCGEGMVSDGGGGGGGWGGGGGGDNIAGGEISLVRPPNDRVVT